VTKARRRTTKIPSRTTVVSTAVLLCIAFSLSVRWAAVKNRAGIGGATVQVEVLNGTGEPGLAMRTAMRLREMGVDVLIVGDAERYDFTESVLIDRRGNSDLVKRLARLIGCRRVLEQVQPEPLVDATLIIGTDVDRLALDRAGEP
jgi:hypothetical protein